MIGTSVAADRDQTSSEQEGSPRTGTWTSEGPNHLRFGPLGLARAMCPPGSLHDRVVRDFEYVRSYVVEDSHLFLSLMADAGIYEYEPASPNGSPSGT